MTEPSLATNGNGHHEPHPAEDDEPTLSLPTNIPASLEAIQSMAETALVKVSVLGARQERLESKIDAVLVLAQLQHSAITHLTNIATDLHEDLVRRRSKRPPAKQ
jgi:hypothetical protein